MKMSLRNATLVACVAWFASAFALVDVASAQAPHPGMAIVDLSYIFQHHKRFQQETEGMKQEVEQREQYFKQQRDGLIQMVEELKRWKPSSPEYKQKEAQIAQTKAKLETDLQLQKKEFVEREASMYHKAYREIVDEVKLYSESNGVMLVFRFNGNMIDPAEGPQPNEVMKQLNKAVVYHNPSIDITPVILHRINSRTDTQGTANRTMPNGYPRPGVR
ncbi:Hypothetical protein PBC10988_13750 [Planctomycetales bacterium 10988]|nr:Hypothetical protein PBC10988_13750 [Planctomycetales bacterium 10988]